MYGKNLSEQEWVYNYLQNKKSLLPLIIGTRGTWGINGKRAIILVAFTIPDIMVFREMHNVVKNPIIHMNETGGLKKWDRRKIVFIVKWDHTRVCVSMVPIFSGLDEEHLKEVMDVALINVIEDSKLATKELLKSKGDTIVYHTKRNIEGVYGFTI